MKAPNITKGNWLAMPPLGKSCSDHGYRAVAHIQRVSPITIYTDRDSLIVDGKGCVFGDVEADAKILAAAPMLAEAAAIGHMGELYERALLLARDLAAKAGEHGLAIVLNDKFNAERAALKAAGYTEAK